MTCKITHAEFEAVRADWTAKLAAAFEKKINEMGDDVRGITWFSSCTDEYAATQLEQAA